MARVIIKATGEIKDLTWNEQTKTWEAIDLDDPDGLGLLSFSADEVTPIRTIRTMAIAENVDGCIVIDTAEDWPESWGKRKSVDIEIHYSDDKREDK